MYSGAVDVLGSLTEKLKQQINDTQDMYESFIDATQLYKQGKMNEKQYFAKIGDYLVSTSALDFLAIRVILEMKSAIDKGTLMKNATGGKASPSPSPSPSPPDSSSPPPQAGFGIGGFVGTGGSVGGGGGEYIMPAPEQQEPTFKPVDIELERPSRKSSEKETTTTTLTKNCIVCGSSIPKQAKFCSKCGNLQ
ncbi:MAG: zinc ribbon domain-containing protein [Thermoproteota archaeon]|nr:zinc ribbon domain-containing protein [Thermoproteota archaeon]